MAATINPQKRIKLHPQVGGVRIKPKPSLDDYDRRLK